ncbi:hypothetical protein PAHAL_3G000700 [Panicum hallii]|uniref:EF-hand domain-containing protein n=1 Tax=Panicum hallii TaxID=206008 RepID=A0A2T8KGG2_9POAL|nr:calcium-binding mitochondrial carrier protein SCaMC-1-A-like [Panicum hallii]PVH61255.1 hypothetical protein PAHAL_3G000700 [Panicum hallii]
MPMASDSPLEAFLAGARGAIAHFHLPIIHIPGSNSSPNPNPKQPQQEQDPEPECLLHLHVVVTNFLHKPLRSLARCFRGDDTKRRPKPRRRGGKHSRPLRDRERSAAAGPQQQLELLLCIAFDAFSHNLLVLEDACKQKGAEFGIATQQFHQFQLLRKVIEGKRANFDGFLSNLGFAKVGAPPPPADIMGASPAPAPISDQEGARGGIEDREEEDNASATPQSVQKLPARLLSIPLSNVERLRSTLSAVSLTELIELVPQLVSRSSTSADGHPDKKKLFSVQDFFRYAEIEGKRFFEELDRDGDGQVTLEDLEIAMRKRRLPRRYARDFLRRTRSNFFSKSIGWKQFLSLMEQKEPTILRAYTTLCLSKSGTLHKNQILTSLKSAGLPANEDNAAAMLRYLNADSEGSISYGHFRNFMLLLPSERLEDDPRSIWFEAATVVAVPPPVEISTGSVLKSALAGGLASALSTSLLHPIDSMKTRVQSSTLSFPELILKLPQIGLRGLYRGSIPAILGQFSSHGLRTGIFEASKLVLTNVAPALPEIQVQSMASFCSTVLGTAVRIPCEVLKQRLQAGIFNNVGEAIVGTMRQDGPMGFFRGTGATLCREVPFYVAGMCLYAEAKKAAQHVAKRDLEPWEIIAVGALSGGLAAVVTTPFDVMKTRMMTAPPGTPVSMQMIVFSILGSEGPLGLFKGAIPRFFWIAPLGAMNFAGYELAKKAMIKDECESRGSTQEKKGMVGSRD